MRISEFAKEIDMQSKEVIAILEENGIEGKKAQSSIDEDQIALVKSKLSKKEDDKPKADIKKAAEKEEKKATPAKENDAKAKAVDAPKKKKPNIILVSNLHNSQNGGQRPQGMRQGGQPRQGQGPSRTGGHTIIKPNVRTTASRMMDEEFRNIGGGAPSEAVRTTRKENIQKSKENVQEPHADFRNGAGNNGSAGGSDEHREKTPVKKIYTNIREGAAGQRGQARDNNGRPLNSSGKSFGGMSMRQGGQGRAGQGNFMSGGPSPDRGAGSRRGNDKRNKEKTAQFEDGFRGKPGKNGKVTKLERPQDRKIKEKEEEKIKVIVLPEVITIKELAEKMKLQPSSIVKQLFMKGQIVTINQEISYEDAENIAVEYDILCEHEVVIDPIEQIMDTYVNVEDPQDTLVPRPPVICVMGHVDHGKTSLLDYVRNTNVIAGEAGGITQHIGAYNVKLKNGKRITFLDTPGHEAFTAMRARGAQVTDIAIIIIAADDAIMPQTKEAIAHAQAAGVPMVFAINKIDKPGANPEKIKEQLANMNLLVEDWGGKYQSQEISAKKGIGVDELMDKVLLEAEMLDLKANPNRKATGSIIESTLDKGRGYVATILCQNGTLHQGDIVLAGTHYGKIKAMFNERGQRIEKALPAEPAVILGLNGAPTAGDTFHVMDSEQDAREICNKREQLKREQGLRTLKRVDLNELGRRIALGDFKELNLVVKGDVDGSIEALSDSLIKLSTEKIQVNVIHKAVGQISESDVTLASASDAIIIGFQVRPSAAARKLAEQEGVDIRLYSIIYDTIEEIKDAMEGMLAPTMKEEVTGQAEVRQVYKITKVGTVAGCWVTEGKIHRTDKIRVIRDGIVVHTGEILALKRFKDDVKEVGRDFECGISIVNYNDIREGDIFETYNEVEVKAKL